MSTPPPPAAATSAGLPHFEPRADDVFVAPFWDAVARDALALPRCSVCRRWQWYPDAAGTDCAGGVLLWEDVATTGTLHTFVRVERAFLPDGRADVPYIVGFVELDGVDGVRLVGNVALHCDPRVGMRVRATFVHLGTRRHPLFEPDMPGVS